MSGEATQMYPVQPHAEGALVEPAPPCRARPGLLTNCDFIQGRAWASPRVK